MISLAFKAQLNLRLYCTTKPTKKQQAQQKCFAVPRIFLNVSNSLTL